MGVLSPRRIRFRPQYIAVTCGALVALCIILRPNHMKIFGGALGVIAGIAMEKYLFNPSETRALDPDDNDVPLAGLLGGLNALRKPYRERKLRETEGLRRS